MFSLHVKIKSIKSIKGMKLNLFQPVVLFALSLLGFSYTGHCNEYNSKLNNFLVVSDIHLNVASTHSMDISPMKQTVLNDLDLARFNELMLEVEQGIKTKKIAEPKFIIILGDMVAHNLFSSEATINNESYVFNYFKKHFPSTPILYTFGNNDSLLSNYGPFVDTERKDELKSPYDVAKKNALWGDGFLSTGTICQNNKTTYPCILKENVENGYYSAQLEAKLRLIALNSVMFSPKSNHVDEKESENQLSWLRAELLNAQLNKDKVMLTMHIPPGNNVYDDSHFWRPKALNEFLTIVNLFHDNIIGILGAHTHKEELKVIHNNQGDIIAGVYFTAALSTFHGNAPSVKTFFYTQVKEQWELVNYETFNFLNPKATVVLNKLYDYKGYYCDALKNNLVECLGQVERAGMMQRYFSAGNPNYVEEIHFQNDILVH